MMEKEAIPTSKLCFLNLCILPIGDTLFDGYQHNISEKAMAPHSSTLAWKIPWMGEPGGLQSMGLLEVANY